jgi:predicted permease
LDHLLLDLRYAFRTLAKHRGFSLAVMGTIGLAIAANSAIFTVVHAVLLRPLPYTEPERLVGIIQQHTSFGPDFATLPDYQDWRDNSTIFESLGGAWSRVYNLTGMDEPERLAGAAVTGNFFATFRVAPAAGRTFTEASTDPREVVLSYGLWQRRFGGDEAVVGRRVALNGQPSIVVGVTPSGFAWPPSAELWVPFVAEPGMNRGYHLLQVVGRLKPGATLDGARAELSTLASQAERAYPAMNKDWGVEAGSLLDYTVSSTRRSLWLLTGAVACVLLIACANIANLLLVRGAGRAAEMAVRLSVGANRGQLVRQLLSESVLLALLGAALGVVVAKWTLDTIASIVPPQAAALVAFKLDPAMLGFAAAMAVATGVAFGLFPALHSTNPALAATLKNQAGQPSGAKAAKRFRVTLATVQIAMSMALLVPAGLFAKSLLNVSRVELGLNADHLVTFSLSPSLNGYDAARTRALFEQLEEKLAAVPGVTNAVFAMVPLLAGDNWNNSVRVQGFEAGPDTNTSAAFNSVGPAFFTTVGMPLLRGRAFTRADGQGAPKVVIVNEAFTRKFNLGADAIGRHMRQSRGDGPLDMEIVGVVRDAKYSDVKAAIVAQYFTPYPQSDQLGFGSFYVRTALPPDQLLAAVPAVVKALDADLPVDDLKTMERQIEENVFLDRMISVLSTAFALLATLLAAVWPIPSRSARGSSASAWRSEPTARGCGGW